MTQHDEYLEQYRLLYEKVHDLADLARTLGWGAAAQVEISNVTQDQYYLHPKPRELRSIRLSLTRYGPPMEAIDHEQTEAASDIEGSIAEDRDESGGTGTAT